jgi:glutamine---fructose-6-phosphate transaminase (isomerizing)
MCGIFGYIGSKPLGSTLLGGLKKLEYRGYDSAGIAAIHDGQIVQSKQAGKIKNLAKVLSSDFDRSVVGIAHTRWATHGLVNQRNAHPHCSSSFAVVHNGIIENYKELKKEVKQKYNSCFVSQTDSEVIIHILEWHQSQGLSILDSLYILKDKIEGSFALGILHIKHPDTIFILKRKSPVILAHTDNDVFFSSDIVAIAPYTNNVIFLEDEHVACLSASGIEVFDTNQTLIQTNHTELEFFKQESYGKGDYEHFMLKEIYEQPEIIESSCKENIDFKNLQLNISKFSNLKKENINRIILLGCGTAYYAACVVKDYLERSSGIPVVSEIASEFRYRSPVINDKVLIVALSQSGETADTISSVQYAKDKGCHIFAICNSPFSTLCRVAHGSFDMKAGLEIGVASTKAFSTMVLSLNYLSLYFKGSVEQELLEFKNIGSHLHFVLGLDNKIKKIAQKYYKEENFLYLGRGASFPLALEGALKLKETSYIHAEGYAGGELKHGPIALIDSQIPIVALLPRCDNFKKMLSNLEEVKARGGQVIAIGSEEDKHLDYLFSDFISVPQSNNIVVQSLINTIPLQLFAYHCAKLLGHDIDQPRNLAKSVTVE